MSCANIYYAGKYRNRIAAYEYSCGNKEKALELYQETVKSIKPHVYPELPVGVFAPMMMIDYIDAMKMIPGTTPKEIIDAAERTMKHNLCRDYQKAYLNKIIDELKTAN